MSDTVRGERIGDKFVVLETLGSGGMGTVVKAWDTQLERAVAIKRIAPGYLESAGAKERLLREARAAAQLRHPNTVQVFEVGSDASGAPYIVMELLLGKDLGRILDEEGALAPKRAVELALDACEGLAAAHARGIFHRDLKPANLFLEQHPGFQRLKVVDFGIAKWATDHGGTLTNSVGAPGTPAYMAPEQIYAGKIDQRTDIWALGVTLYKLLIGELPQQIMGLPLRTSPLGQLENGLVQVLERCLELEPSRRFANLAELAQALLPYSLTCDAQRVLRINATLAGDTPGASGPVQASERAPEPAKARAELSEEPTQTTEAVALVPAAAQREREPSYATAAPPSKFVPNRVLLASALALFIVAGVVLFVFAREPDAPGAIVADPKAASSLAKPAEGTERPSGNHSGTPVRPEAAQPAVADGVKTGSSAEEREPTGLATPEPNASAAVVKAEAPRKASAVGPRLQTKLCTDGKKLCPCDDPNCVPPRADP